MNRIVHIPTTVRNGGALVTKRPVYIQFVSLSLKKTKSATMNMFGNFLFFFKSFVKVQLSCVFTLNLFTTAENCMEK